MKYTRTQETMASFVELKQNVVEKEEIILEFDGEDHIRERHMGKRQEFTSQFNIREEDVFTLIWDTIKSLRNNLTWVKKLQYSEMLFSFFSIYVLKFLFTILIVYKKKSSFPYNKFRIQEINKWSIQEHKKLWQVLSSWSKMWLKKKEIILYILYWFLRYYTSRTSRAFASKSNRHYVGEYNLFNEIFRFEFSCYLNLFN